MKTVNPFYIHALLSPLTGLADDDDAVNQYSKVDVDNEHQVRAIIRSRLKPYFLRFDDKSKEISKLSLKYYLSKPGFDFARIYDSCLMPFESPSDPRRFFEWLWRELFGDEKIWIESATEFIESKDIHAPNLIKLADEPNQN